MSGGSMDYVYLHIKEAAELTEDKTIAQLLMDLSKVLHDEEWADCCDISDEEYQDTLLKFKRKWLEQEPKTKALGEELQSVRNGIKDETVLIGYNMAVAICNKYLSDKTEQEPKTEWIPVSERLPEDLEAVNITWVNHEPEPYYHDIKDRNFTATGIHYRGKWYWYSTTCADYLGEYGSNEVDEVDSAIEIVAWMPLPKPYKEG